MPHHTFLTVPIGRNVGLTSVSAGLVRALDRLGIPFGFFKALGQPHPEETFDRSSAYLNATTTLTPPTPIDYQMVVAAMNTDSVDDLMEEVITRYEQLPPGQEAIIVEGLVPTSDLPHAHRLNVALRRTLNAEVVLVMRPEKSSCSVISNQLRDLFDSIPKELFDRKPGVVINHLDTQLLADELGCPSCDPSELLPALRKSLGPGSDRFDLIGLVPFQAELSYTRVVDAIAELNGTVIFPGNMEQRRIKKISLCARTVANSIRGFTSGTLVVTPADRSDIIVGAALAASKSIQLAGLIITGDTEPDEKLLDYCSDEFSLHGGLPVLRVPSSSFEISRALHELNPEIPVEDVDRINLVMDTVARHVDSGWISQRCATHVAKRLSPPAFRHRISKTARANQQRIVLPEGEEPRTIEAAVRCAERGIAECHLIGNPRQIEELARINELEIPPAVKIIDPESIRHRYLAPLLERRKHKGLTEANAIEALRDNVTLGTMMLAMDEVDGLVSGAIHSTASTIRPALQLIRTAPHAKVVSSVFFMCLPDQVLVYGDCAVNPDPDAETLADIAIQSAASAKAFGIDPIVAMISYSTLGSGSGSEVEKVREATAIARKRAPELIIDGPLQYDAASNREVAATKAPDSEVAGRANVFIFPDLNTGNTTYKAVQRSAGVISMGPMLQGMRKPVNDLSRGASVEDILYTIALTAVQAQG
ncbi:phosphate acetyltransferase [Haloferula rosea]|uniref:Phosphate acetyltransferase n=1 Tax=Haloferula rosea TaxID=490093 RepID=A0A934RAM3_9BACT|nr:phosphate acetyltransferase [Haloferula rosea]MBK1826258.1 phosphate acetyltransferase [Haloferula rosea]